MHWVKKNVHYTTSHEGSAGDKKYTSTLSLTFSKQCASNHEHKENTPRVFKLYNIKFKIFPLPTRTIVSHTATTAWDDSKFTARNTLNINRYPQVQALNPWHTLTSSSGCVDDMETTVFHIVPSGRAAPFHPKVGHPLHPAHPRHRACHKT